MTCDLVESVADSCIAGDKVLVTGVVSVFPIGIDSR